ncbi:MAG: helix-turn-helix transcriptional regulator [Clostridia bacterium]|nr:helix-turn-helix transcriptional regulator [Clostridia bacterium]
MYNANELRFLTEVFAKSNIPVKAADASDKLGELLSDIPDGLLSRFGGSGALVGGIIDKLEDKTLYRRCDAFGICCMYFKTRTRRGEELFFIGPYLSVEMSRESILEICEKEGIGPGYHRLLTMYYSSLPILSNDSPLYSMLDVFCSHAFEKADYSIIDMSDAVTFDSVISMVRDKTAPSGEALGLKLMEQRYEYENELMAAVASGDLKRGATLFAAVTDTAFEHRISDKLRSTKNYAVIMNTLMRKAAERGGVHPIYIDALSASFSQRIEQAPSTADIFSLMRDMYAEYCRLVRKHAGKEYSPIVKHAVILIRAGFASDISLKTLAEACGVSSGYLSSAFSREVGKTVTQYIKGERVKHAKSLLETTNLQIQTVALFCGVVDVQYFTKLFKSEVGISPKEYREREKMSKKG